MHNDIWLITRSALDAHLALEARAARGEAIPPATRGATQPQGNVAVLDMVGVLVPGDVPAYAKGYATSTTALAQQFRDAAGDPNVSAIVLRCDSPGGYVKGTQELSDTIYSLRGKKPMQTLVDGQCCSAALWAGSATGKIVIGSDTAQVGSIGAIAVHVDTSGALAAAGYKVSEITSSKFKAAGSPHRPLDEMGRAEIQKSVDHAHGVFTSQLGRNLGMSKAAVDKVATGQVFHGREAIEAGLAQGMAPFHSALASFAAAHGRMVAAVKAAPALIAGRGDVALKARIYVEQQRKLGRHVTASEAVAYINSTL